MSSVTFSSAAGSSLVAEVNFNLTDDLTALEGEGFVMLSLNASSAVGVTAGGGQATSVLSIKDDDRES